VLKRDLVTEALARPELPRLTNDVDGSVAWTAPQSAGPAAGSSPHPRRDPRYYPLIGHVTQTGCILRLKKQLQAGYPFRRDLIDSLGTRFGRPVTLEFHVDAAFFQRGILQLLTAWDCEHATKVGYWRSCHSRRSRTRAAASTQPPGAARTPRSRPTCRWACPLRAFACGLSAQEKTVAERKSAFALDVVPTKHYAANSS
jgi:hypothetical protein